MTDQSTSSDRGALAGITVLDLTRLLPGGVCTMLLADLGAEVVKVEDKGSGDYARWSGPVHAGAPDGADRAMFVNTNRNKRSIQLDLKTSADRDSFLALVEGADVVVESFRPGVMARLDIGYEVLAGRNPGVVLCSISGYGQTGPDRLRSGHDINYLARAGLLGLSGDVDRPPASAAGQIADIGGGAQLAAFAILAALHARERDRGSVGSGLGQHVDVSMFDGVLSWLPLVSAEELTGGRTPGRGSVPFAGGEVCYRSYACADGDVALGALEEKFWRSFCEGIGRPDLIPCQFDPPGSAAHADLETIFGARTRGEWEQFAAEHDCCLEPVRTVGEALASEQVKARDMLVRIGSADGAVQMPTIGHPVTFSRTPADVHRLPPPLLGQHTAEIVGNRSAGR